LAIKGAVKKTVKVTLAFSKENLLSGVIFSRTCL